MRRFCLGCSLSLILSVLLQAQTTISVGADSSLRGVLAELAQVWADQQNEGRVEISFANLETLKKQIENQNQWDVVILAGSAVADELTQKGRLMGASQKQIARNELVVLGRKPLLADEELEWFELLRQEWSRISIGNPELVASGRAAQAAMEKRGIWKQIKSNARLASNELLAIDFAKRNEVDAVFIWSTDAKDLQLSGYQVFKINAEDYAPMFYVATLGATSKQEKTGTDFIQFLVHVEARKIWMKWGFL